MGCRRDASDDPSNVSASGSSVECHIGRRIHIGNLQQRWDEIDRRKCRHFVHRSHFVGTHQAWPPSDQRGTNAAFEQVRLESAKRAGRTGALLGSVVAADQNQRVF